MATSSAVATIVGQSCYNYGWHIYKDTAMYAGKTESYYYPYVLQFTTPKFVGTSESLAVTLGASKGYGNPVTLRYAICTSDANRGSYLGTYDPVTDTNQIVTGTWTMSDLESSSKPYSIDIATNKLKASTTYYLFLWGYDASSMWVIVSKIANHTVTLNYNDGLVYIYDGSSFKPYQAYVYNGSSWDLCLPYTYNGKTWDVMS